MGKKKTLSRALDLVGLLRDGERALERAIDVADVVRDGATKGREALVTVRNGLARVLGQRADKQPPIRVHAQGVEVKPRRK